MKGFEVKLEIILYENQINIENFRKEIKKLNLANKNIMKIEIKEIKEKETERNWKFFKVEEKDKKKFYKLPETTTYKGTKVRLLKTGKKWRYYLLNPKYDFGIKEQIQILNK